MCVDLTIVIPAFDEVERLPAFLASIRDYFAGPLGEGVEVIVVDDGSRDGTGALVRSLSESWGGLVLIEHATNLGKGAAVRDGVLAAHGELVLFADADGATPICEERKLREAIVAGADVAIGSRIKGRAIERSRRWYRGLFGWVFAELVRNLLSLPVLDTQCGFKMFRRKTGQQLFDACRENGYLFDIDVLLRSVQLGLTVAEVPVSWSDRSGSKVRLVHDSVRMLCGLIRIRRDHNAEANDPRLPVAVAASLPPR